VPSSVSRERVLLTWEGVRVWMGLSWLLRCHEAVFSEEGVSLLVASKWLGWPVGWVEVEWLRIAQLLANAFRRNKHEPSVDATCEEPMRLADRSAGKLKVFGTERHEKRSRKCGGRTVHKRGEKDV
jgi:hypothetical protein